MDGGIEAEERADWETWKAAAQRQHTWLQWKDAQLNCLAQLLLRERLWTKERRFQVGERGDLELQVGHSPFR